MTTNCNVNKVPGWTIPIPTPSYTLPLQIISGPNLLLSLLVCEEHSYWLQR